MPGHSRAGVLDLLPGLAGFGFRLFSFYLTGTAFCHNFLSYFGEMFKKSFVTTALFNAVERNLITLNDDKGNGRNRHPAAAAAALLFFLVIRAFAAAGADPQRDSGNGNQGELLPP